jgi:B-cell receptor-associated protein 31
MSLQWNVVFGVLCTEILTFLVLLVLPHGPYLARIARSRAFAKSKYILRILFYIMAFFFLDAMRQMYALESEKDATTQPATEVSMSVHANLNMRLFRAQRNAYLTFFTVFLMLVLNRFCNVIFEVAELKEKCALLEQAAPEQVIEQIDRLVAARYDVTPATEAEAAARMDSVSDQDRTATSLRAEELNEEHEADIQRKEENLPQATSGQAAGISKLGVVSDDILPHNRVQAPEAEGLPALYTNKRATNKRATKPAEHVENTGESLVSRLTQRLLARHE